MVGWGDPSRGWRVLVFVGGLGASPLEAPFYHIASQPDRPLLGRSVDGFTAGFPLSVLDDGRDAMVAYAMNGEPLPVKHGFPARLVVPGLYGYVSATKWLAEIRLTTLDRDVPFWLSRGWAADGTIRPCSSSSMAR